MHDAHAVSQAVSLRIICSQLCQRLVTFNQRHPDTEDSHFLRQTFVQRFKSPFGRAVGADDRESHQTHGA